MNDYVFTNGCKEFKIKSAFPVGGNTFSYGSDYKLVCNKTDIGTAALAVFDLNRVSRGSRLIFEVDVRVLNGSEASISIDSRTSYSLTAGRKTTALKKVSNKDWERHRVEWIVTDEYININLGGGIGATGTYEFRNPVLNIHGADNRLSNTAHVHLVRLNGVWGVDKTNFSVSNDIDLVSATGGSIVLKWAHTGQYAPTVNVTVDTGWELNVVGFVAAGPNTVQEEGCNIRLIKIDGTYATDVTIGGNTRLHITLHW